MGRSVRSGTTKNALGLDRGVREMTETRVFWFIAALACAARAEIRVNGETG
jgi:hypothetical protein